MAGQPQGVTGPVGARKVIGAPPGVTGPIGGTPTPMRAWKRLNKVLGHTMPSYFHRAERHSRLFQKVIR